MTQGKKGADANDASGSPMIEGHKRRAPGGRRLGDGWTQQTDILSPAASRMGRERALQYRHAVIPRLPLGPGWTCPYFAAN